MNTDRPQFLSIRQIAKTGILPERLLRQLHRKNELPGFYSGRKYLVNYTLLLKKLNDEQSGIYGESKRSGD